MKQADFLLKLEAEAARQAQLYQHRILPPQLDGFNRFICQYPWQVILVVSGLTAAVLFGARV